MSMHFDALADRAVTDGVIAPEEILALRREGWSNGTIEADEAEALFLANDALRDPSPEWVDFFVEALTEYALASSSPRGYISQMMADTLVARISRDGQVDSMAELELIVRLLEKAVDVPTSLKDFALRQIESTVLTGSGPTRRGELTEDGINALEAGLLRRMIFAAGGDRPAAVSQAEAAMLFRLKDVTLGRANVAEWKNLFVQGVANFLLASAHDQLPADRAAELEHFMAVRGTGQGGVLGIIGKMARSDVGDSFSTARQGRMGSPDHFADMARSARLDSAEKDWLLDQLTRSPDSDDYEKALVAFIVEETGQSISG
jgi:hypothetical protein